MLVMPALRSVVELLLKRSGNLSAADLNTFDKKCS